MSKKQCSLMLVLALLAGLAGGVVSSQFLIGQPVFAEKVYKTEEIFGIQDVLITKKLIIQDEEGKARAIIHEDGIEIRDEKLKTVFRIVVALPLTTFVEIGGTWPTPISMGVLDGKPFMDLSDNKSITRSHLSLDSDGNPSLKFYDRNKTTRAVLGNTDLEQAQTGVVQKRPPSSLVLFNEEGNVIWQAP